MELKHYFIGACVGILIFILAFTSRYIGAFTLVKVIIAFSALAILYFVFRDLSDFLSLHFKKRMFYQTTRKLEVWEGDEFIEIFQFRKIFWARFSLVLLFILSFVLITGYFVNLRIFFHEIGHLLVALSFNLQVWEVFISTTEGHVISYGDTTLGQTNLLIVSGTLWLVVVGMIFLIALHRDKKMPLTLNASLSIIIWITVFNDIYYWFMGSIPGIGDPYELLISNPGLHPSVVTYSSLVFLIILFVFILCSLGYKMYSQIKLILDELIPDLTIFNAQEER